MTTTTALRKVSPTGEAGDEQPSLLKDSFGLDPAGMTTLEKARAISGYDMRYRIEAMVAGISRKKIRHRYRGDGASTSPGVMTLPRISATALFPHRHVSILLGYTAHEIGHQLKSDFAMLSAFLDDPTIENGRKRHLKEIWNGIEDYRIEKLVRYEYPGFHVEMDVMHDFTTKRFCERVAAGFYSERELANPYLLTPVAITWLGHGLNGYATNAPRDALALIDPALRAWIESWTADLSTVETDQDAFDLANRMMDDLDLARERARAAHDGASSDSDADDASGGGLAGGSGGDWTGQSEEEEEERPRPDVQDGDEQCQAEGPDFDIEDLLDMISEMPGPTARDAIIHGEKLLGSRTGKGDAQTDTMSGGHEEYQRLRGEVGTSAARSAGILRRVLQSTVRRGWKTAQDHGELDFGLVVGMMRGSSNVYRQRTVRSGVNTAVSLLLDNSGSMAGNPLQICQKTSIVLDMAIQGTGTNLEITGFTGNEARPVLYRYRAFGQNGRDAAASLGNMANVELGGTPVSTPLLEAWRRLSKQKEPRRLMIVVSDGGADLGDVRNAREAHDFIVANGGVVLGIAVGVEDAMRRWCDNVQPIDTMEDLPIALMNLVREAMP